jgi:hypothetical protein
MWSAQLGDAQAASVLKANASCASLGVKEKEVRSNHTAAQISCWNAFVLEYSARISEAK